MMSNLYLSPLWTSTPGRRGEEGSVRDRNTEWEGEMDGLMEWWHKKWTHSLRRFAKTPIKQFFSKVYLDSLHQDVHFPSYFPLLVFPSFFFLMAPQLWRQPLIPFIPHTYFMSLSSHLPQFPVVCIVPWSPLPLSLPPLSPSLPLSVTCAV